MSDRTTARLAKKEEIDLLYDLVHARLEATWRDIELLARLVKAPTTESEGVVTDALFDFLAEQLVDQEIAVKDAKKILGDAMKDALADVPPGEEEEEEEEEDE